MNDADGGSGVEDEDGWMMDDDADQEVGLDPAGRLPPGRSIEVRPSSTFHPSSSINPLIAIRSTVRTVGLVQRIRCCMDLCEDPYAQCTWQVGFVISISRIL